MVSLTEMKKTLKPLGIYTLDGTTLVDKELESYAAALDRAIAVLDELIKECFAETAESYGITRREKMYTVPDESLPIEERRQRLIYRLSLQPSDFHVEGIARAMRSAGFTGTIVEDLPGQRLLLTGIAYSGTPEELKWIIAAANEIFPAHLGFSLDLKAPTWDELDALGYRFNRWDGIGLPWDTFYK